MPGAAPSTAADTPALFGGELYAAATSGLVRLADPVACERLLRARRPYRLDLNAVTAGRREAIDLAQRAVVRYGARLKACRAALALMETAIGDDTAAARDAGVGAARDALAAALAPGFGDAP